MDWKELPGFDEKYAKITIKPHKTFDGKVIEVLYGAKDDQGNLVYPKDANEDGCGRWFGIESNGVTTMFAWSKPGSSEVEYTTEYKEQAVEVMEEEIRQKQDLCRQAEATNDLHEFDEIETKFNALHDWKTAKDEEYAKRFDLAKQRFARRKQDMEQAVERKTSLVQQAEQLVSSTDWHATFEAFKTLQEEWRNAGYAGDQDDALWEKFNTAKNTFHDARRQFFATLDQQHEKAQQAKEALIEKTKQIVEAGVTNYQKTSQVMAQLMEDWKAAGSAGRKVDDTLWETFNGLRQKFYDARQTFFKEREEAMASSVEAKEAIIAKAKEIVAAKQFDKESTDAMIALDVDWRKAGYSGRERSDALWQAFKEVKEEFWNERHVINQKRLADVIARKEKTIVALREEINDLEIRKFETSDFQKIHGMERRVEEKKEVIEQLRRDIENLQSKLK